jgi:hypothetical protein
MQHDFSVWYKTTTEKILAWRELRSELAENNVDQVISRVNDWWTYSPWVKKTVDPYKPETWPTPWELLDKGEFCRSAIALGQAYTLWMCSHPDTKIELWLVNNFSEKDIHLVVVIEEKTMLNYTLGQILEVEKCDFEILDKFDRSNLSHIKI